MTIARGSSSIAESGIRHSRGDRLHGASSENGTVMKKRILMVNPPLFLGEAFIDYPLFTLLGVVSNAAVLRESSHNVSVADSFSLDDSIITRHEGVSTSIGASIACVLESCEELSPDTVVVSISPFMFPHVLTDHCASIFKQIRISYPEIRVVAADCNFSGMHYIEYDGREFLNRYPQVDTVVKYECENRLPGVIDECAGNFSTIVNSDSSGIIPDNLPTPAWDLISLTKYYAFQRKYSRFFSSNKHPVAKRSLPVITSRGCPFECVFCTSNPGQKNRNYRANTPEYIHRLLSHYTQRFHTEKIVFLDSIPNLDHDRFLSILEIVKSLNLSCDFPNGLRADCLSMEHLKILKTISSEVKISAESASANVMAGLNKSLSPGATENVAAWCHELKIPLSIHYIIGAPYENPEEANETLTYAVTMQQKFGAKPLVQYLSPIPGSAIHKYSIEKGLLKDFDPHSIYDYFTKKTAFDRPEFPARKLQDMMRSFRKRTAGSAVEKVIINLTYMCSNDCVFCAIGDRERKHGDVGRSVGFLKKYRSMGIDSVDFDGGEPTLFPNFFNIVAVAKELGYTRINVTTNARRLADRASASRFLLSGLTSVLVSLHGHTADLHEKHTRREGSFSETIQGIKNIVELKPQRVQFAINTSITQWNAPYLSEFIEYVRELGAARVNLQFITPHGNARQNEENDIELLIEHVAGAVGKWGGEMALSLINLPACISRRITGVMEPETEKYSRDMVFVDNPPMNLGLYLDQRRAKRPECRSCDVASACAGFYLFPKE
jgi:MoaA/NifB/PqqE/SkfB family radical SAM enzyme